MLEIIIPVAIIAFLIVLFIIYFKEIKKIFFKGKKSKKQDKPKEKKKEPVPSVEEFKPIYKPVEDETRDSSLESLLSEEDFPFDIDDIMDDDFNLINANKPSMSNQHSNEDFDIKSILNKKYGKNEGSNKKSISKTIQELPPEIKALLIDNVLKKRDDV